MAKSLRSKIKRHYRAKKREVGVFAAAEAAKVEHLSAKLAAIRDTDKKVLLGDNGEEEENQEEGATEHASQDKPASDEMDVEGQSTPKKISTHGRTPSRREEWRIAKGKPAKPKSKGMNRQGGLAGRRKPGRSHRRR